MKKHYLLPFLLIIGYGINAQVGINTPDPKATLDIVSGTSTTIADGIIPPRLTGDQLLAREARYTLDQDGAMVYVTQGRTTSVGSNKTIGVTTKGFYVFDSSLGTAGLWARVDTQQAGVPASAYSARFSGNGTLLGLSLLSNKRTYLNLPQASGSGTTVNIPSNNVDASGAYNVTESGIYRITYKYRESGISLNLAGASVDIFKNDAVMESTPMVLVDLAVNNEIDNIYNLASGDKLKFGTTKTGLLVLNLLNVVNAEIIIHRIR